MMSLSTFMDASGKPEHGPEEWCVVAGFLANVEQWERFEIAWKQMLSEYEIPHLQMSALHARKPPFEHEKWDNETYMASFLSRAGAIVRSHVQMWGVDAVKNGDFTEAGAQRSGLEKYTNAYGLCGTAVALRLQMAKIWNHFPQKIPIEHFFEEGDKGVANIGRVFSRCGMQQPIVRPGKPQPSDPNQRYYVQFQAADWLAFESRKIARKYFPERPFIRQSMKALLKGIPGEAKVWTLQDVIKFCDRKMSKGEMG